MIGAEINEEKSSKSMEIIISSVSPQTHFLSKLVAANIFALIQGVLLLVYILIGLGIKVATTGPVELSSFVETFAQSEGTYVDAEEVKEMIANNNIIPRIKTGLPVIIVIVVLTFIVYTLFIGILASVTTSMEDFNQVQTPVMIVLMAGYFLAVYAALFKGSVFIKAMSFVPFISGILSPVLYILGQVKLYEMGISILILAGVIFVLYKYGLKVYKVGILNYSSSNLWKKIFKALKD
jgi:ABC-2 type transport system permease protein